MTGELAAAYTSGSQKARNVTEAWGADNFYCPNCSSQKLDWLKRNTKANDYRCPNCEFWFQLKSQQARIGNLITDGAYGAMMEAIKNDRTPNFFFMQYELATWSVKNLLLVPHFAFPPSAIIERKPLSPIARRAGWIGCNIALNRIPIEARISLVNERQIASENEVREKFKKVKPLKEISVSQRGWTLDVLNIVRRLGKPEFTNEEVYAFTRELEQLHPDNRYVRDKIRQQLQVLRDTGFLTHVSRSEWKLK